MRYIILTLLLLSMLGSSALTDRAYRAYKSKHYKKALQLYKEATNSGSLESQAKAEYNLGVFYLKGIGIEKSKKAALLHFRHSYLIGQGIPETLEKFYYSTQAIKVQRDTHNYLAKLESSPAKRAKHKKIAKLLNSALKERQRSKPKEQLSARTKQFLKHCKAARVVAITDRKELEILNCSLFKRYPKKIRHYFHQRKVFQQATDSADREHYSETVRDKAYKTMVRDLSPIFKNYLKKEIQCIKKAQTYGEIFHCQTDYLAELDKLLFQSNLTNINDSLHLFSSKEERTKSAKHFKAKVDPKERAKKIQELQHQLATKEYVTPY